MEIYDDFVKAIRDRLVQENLSARAAAARAGLPTRSVQGILEGHIPSIERAAEVASALGLEFYVGPQRSTEQAIRAEPKPAGDSEEPPAWAMDLLKQFKEFHAASVRQEEKKKDEVEELKQMMQQLLEARSGDSASSNGAAEDPLSTEDTPTIGCDAARVEKD